MEWWYKDYRNLLPWPLWMQPFSRLVKYRFVRPFHQAHFGLFTACFLGNWGDGFSRLSAPPIHTGTAEWMQRQVVAISVAGDQDRAAWPSSRCFLSCMSFAHKMTKPNPFAAKDLAKTPRLVSAQLPWDESAFLRLASANDWANKRTRHREERRVHRLLRLTIRKVLMAWSTWRVLCGSLIYNQVRQVTVEVCLKFVWKSIACIDLTKAAYFQRRWRIRGKDHAALIL